MCAVGRSILIIIWHLLADPAARFTDLGPDRHDQRAGRDRKIRSHLRQLTALDIDVTVNPTAAKDKTAADQARSPRCHGPLTMLASGADSPSQCVPKHRAEIVECRWLVSATGPPSTVSTVPVTKRLVIRYSCVAASHPP